MWNHYHNTFLGHGLGNLRSYPWQIALTLCWFPWRTAPFHVQQCLGMQYKINKCWMKYSLWMQYSSTHRKLSNNHYNHSVKGMWGWSISPYFGRYILIYVLKAFPCRWIFKTLPETKNVVFWALFKDDLIADKILWIDSINWIPFDNSRSQITKNMKWSFNKSNNFYKYISI